MDCAATVHCRASLPGLPKPPPLALFPPHAPRNSLRSLLVLTPSQPQELAYQLNDSNASLIFLVPALLPAFEAARPHLRTPIPNERVILLCKPEDKPSGTPHKIITEFYGPPTEHETFDGAQAQATAWICYSSGTTGLPKGVMMSHFNLTSQLQTSAVGVEQLKSGKDVVLGVLPMSHVYGLAFLLMNPMTMGCPVVVLPRFEEVAALSAIQKVRRRRKKQGECG